MPDLTASRFFTVASVLALACACSSDSDVGNPGGAAGVGSGGSGATGAGGAAAGGTGNSAGASGSGTGGASTGGVSAGGVAGFAIGGNAGAVTGGANSGGAGAGSGGTSSGGASSGGAGTGASSGFGPVQCRANSDCPATMTCALSAPGGICNGCSLSAPCKGAGLECFLSACVRDCTGDQDCNAGMRCNSTKRCVIRACPCPAPYVCGGSNLCQRPACGTGATCPTPFTCQNGFCMEP